jgi:clan AA aspartic protease (TIGR02281 family)
MMNLVANFLLNFFKANFLFNNQATMKIKLSILFIVLVNTSFSQFNLDEILKFKIGLEYNIAKSLIKNKFQNDITLWKGDFFNSILIESDNKSFDNYGEANYRFTFIKNKLATIEMKFEFNSYDQWKVIRLLRNMLNDITDRYSPATLAEISDLKIDEVSDKIDMICKQILEGKSIHTFIGRQYSILNKKSFPDSKVIAILVTNTQKTTSQNSTITYKCIPTVTLWVSNYRMWGAEDTLRSSGVNYNPMPNNEEEISLTFSQGVYKLPVRVNNLITMDFILDLGASNVSISPDLFAVLIKSGTIKSSDFIGTETYQLADGSTAKSKTFYLRKLMIGNIEISNVKATVSNSINAPLLLGQSALKKLGTYSIDNKKLVLKINKEQ